MNCIAEIKKKLASYPELEWELEGSTISVSPEGGFTVWLTESEDDCTVGYNGWHEDFEDKKEALECFAFGLSEKCRLKVFSRGKTEYKWVMEGLEGGKWISYSTTCLIFIPFWQKSVSTICKIMSYTANKFVNRTFFATLRFAVASPLYRKTPLHKKCLLQRRYESPRNE